MADAVETPIGRVTAAHFRPERVRHQVFVGPKFLYALFTPTDEMHVIARAFMDFLRDGELPYRQLIVNEHVVDEAATRLKKQASMRQASTFLTTLDDSTVYRLEFAPEDVFAAATETFRAWTDLDASLTDFVVATHADEMDVEYVLTFDSHFGAFDVTMLPYRD